MPGQPVRVSWPRSDEFRFGPVGAPMLVETTAEVDAGGRIAAWRHEIWSAPHGQRPGGGGNVNLLAAVERDPSLKAGDIADLPAAIGGGASRNAAPIYAFPKVAVATHIVQGLPVRASSLRGLGAQMNTVAIEATMDRIAREQGEDPFAIRRRHLDDPRALAVLDALEARTEAARAAVADREDAAIGIALGRYKNKAAYAAVAARILLEDAPRLAEVWAVVDAGRVISADGTRNQIEGGILQAASWTLVEGVLLREGRIDAMGWEDYPVFGWEEMPALDIEVIDRPDAPPLGVGECMVGPVSAAIVNAVSAALGETLATLPLDRDALISALA
jgi:CO/xanthine dehydrogenase Mo-binding subunit